MAEAEWGGQEGEGGGSESYEGIGGFGYGTYRGDQMDGLGCEFSFSLLAFKLRGGVGALGFFPFEIPRRSRA